MAISTNPNQGLAEFFDGIWGTEEGFVYLPAKNQDEPPKWHKSFYAWPLHAKQVVEHVLLQSAQGNDVYFSPVVWEKPKLERSAIKGTNVVWADFDGNVISDPEEWVREPQSDGSEAQGSVPGAPSIVVQSSLEDRQHVYWKLDEFSTDLSFVESTNRSIAYVYGADTSGWDVEQILRPPFSTNYKHDLPVLVSSFDSITYSASSFTGFAPVKQLVHEGIDDTNLPDPVAVIAQYKWDTDTADLLNKDIPEGSRSSALMRIGYKCAELGLSDSEAYAILLFLDDRLGKFRNRNDRKKRLLDILNKARQRYPSAVVTPSNEEPTLNQQYVYGFASFLKADISVEWAIKDLMPRQGCGLITAAPTIGKTQLTLQMGIHHALGKRFLGWDFLYRGKGLFFSLEMGAPGLLQLSTTIGEGYSESELGVLDNNLKVIPLGEPMPLSLPKANMFLESIIEEYRPDFVHFDSLQKIMTGKITDDEAARSVFNYLSRLRAKYDFYTWIVHHNRKAQGDNKAPRTIDDVYGSVYITAEPDTIISMYKKNATDKEIEVINPKNRFAEIKESFFIKRTEHLNFYRTDLEGSKLLDESPLGIGPPDTEGENWPTALGNGGRDPFG